MYVSVTKVDLAFLTETWLKPSDRSVGNDFVPPGYDGQTKVVDVRYLISVPFRCLAYLFSDVPEFRLYHNTH